MSSEFKKWWNSERVNRFEKGTSQDYCPTNGGVVLYASFWCAIALLIFLIATLGVK